MAKVTPMLAQYEEIKAQFPDCILFYRIGDFYEMLFQDAIDASEILDITLTKKHLGGEGEPPPLCGVPYHAAESYLARLLAAGRKVAICDQTENPALAKGLVRREVTRVLTPGTATSELMLSPDSNNYLAALYLPQTDGRAPSPLRGNSVRAARGALAWIDLSTSECGAAALSPSVPEAMGGVLFTELARLDPSEVILCADTDAESSREIAEIVARETGVMTSERPLDEFYSAPGAKAMETVDAAIAGLLAYLRYTQRNDKFDFGQMPIRSVSDRMILGRETLRNLELTEPLSGKGEHKNEGTLLGVLDKTKTAMGTRLLKNWIRAPLIRLPEILARQDAVSALLEDVFGRNHIREALRQVYDLERLCGRMAAATANGRDLLALRQSLSAVTDVRGNLPEGSALLEALAGEMDEEQELCAHIGAALKEEQPLSVREGNMIKKGYSEELDGIGEGLIDGRDRIAQLESKERERTGIRSLKIRYNRVQGYTIEVSATNLGLVPEDYLRKATLANAERFVTQELKDVEREVLTAGERRSELEYELFQELRECALARIDSIRATAAALAQVDVLQSFAEAAQTYAYTKPQVEESDRLFIFGGRHPVLERSIEKRRGAGNFVKNDLSMNLADESLLLITGPNMGGKSTYMRQAALIVLMAQIGSFVPADEARIGLCDRIFTRIGASDNLAREQSTFLVEMNELSDILRNYSEKSLILLDEIGRGTSTYDGLAIAWAACDWLCGAGRRARCLFATHYHELTALEGRLPGLKNLSTAVDDRGDRVVYLHKIRAGASSRSYGIHVAEMAGLPAALTQDAREKLALLEAEAKDVRAAVPPQTGRQLSFLDEGQACATGEYENDSNEEKTVGPAGASGEFGNDPNNNSNARAEEAARPEHGNDARAEEITRLLRDTQVMELTPAAAIALVEHLKRLAVSDS